MKYYYIPFLLLFGLCACKRENSVEEIAKEIVICEPDTSVVGVLNSISNDSLSYNINNKTASVAHAQATADGKIIGGLGIGDTLAIQVDPNTKNALSIVNLSTLKGKWIYDTKQERGFVIDPRGALSSENPESVSFRRWKIHNGHLLIYYRDPEKEYKNADECSIDTTVIESLTPTELSFRFNGKLLNCTREQKQAEPIKLVF